MGILTIGIDIGGTNFRIGTVDENDEIQNFEKIPAAFLTTAMLWKPWRTR